MSSSVNRRRFLQTVAAGGAGYFFTAAARSAERAAAGPNGKVHFGCIGVGGKGSGDSSQAGKVGTVVALCDIDEKTLARKGRAFPDAKTYFDFRKMLDEMGHDIDAVTVSTPDHTHAVAAIMAMKMKKHVYCQKPLTHSVYEARQMREVARQTGVATQMGNQGSASNVLRRAVELIQGGVIGPVKEVHVWTNRPIWPQGGEAVVETKAGAAAAFAALEGHPVSEIHYPEVPRHVHWDLWLGPAKERPYDPIYHPFKWRGWWDFGTGALGDMACHTANLAFRALKLGYPVSVVADATGVNPQTYPTAAKVTLKFPEREGLPPVTLTWYEGRRNGKKLQPPPSLVRKVLEADPSEGRKKALSESGSILVGERGILYTPHENGTEVVLYPAKDFVGLNRTKPEKLPAGADGRGSDQRMKAEWVEAIEGGPPAYSNFEFAGLLTEAILLGNIAIRLTGEKLEWDGPALRFTNNARANQYLRYEYRKGWAL
jgi:predicted dehydrogenase